MNIGGNMNVGGMGCRPPSYARAVNLNNTTASTVKVVVHFQSGDSETYEIAANASVKAEKEINHGSWTAVDPVLRAEIAEHNALLAIVAQGVQILTYNISDDNGALYFAQV
jgi:hypothetical protein